MTAQAAEIEDTPSRSRGLVLRLWGIDAEHIARARQAVAYHPSRNYWRITDTQVDESPVSTIHSFEPDAVAQKADFGWAWAVYPAEPLQDAA